MIRIMLRSLFIIPVLLLATGPALKAADGSHEFVGTKNCKKCHLKEWKSWSATKMATSFETLKPGERAEAKTKAGLDPANDYTADPECVRCHTVGYGLAGGYDIAKSPDEQAALQGTGCEMCHGAGGTYTQDEFMSLKNKEYARADVVAAGMTGEITKEVCETCHNTDSPFVGEGYVFDFETRKEEGTHEKYPLKYTH